MQCMQCNSCAKTFKQKVRLVKHEQVCLDFGFVNKECPFGGTLFPGKIDFEWHKQHMRKPNGSYKYFCHECGKRFCTYDMLVYHRNIETKDTGYVRKSFGGETEKTERWERNKALAKKNDDDPESDDMQVLWNKVSLRGKLKETQERNF